MRPSFFALATFVLALGGVACKQTPDEIVGKDPNAKPQPPGGGGAGATGPATPIKAPLGLQANTAGLPPSGTLYADFDTDMGKISCKLLDDKAPIAVANFVGLARGVQPFQDPVSQQWVKRPAYDGVVFHRVVKGFMIQGGDPSGLGTGDPGYVFPDEVWPGSKHDHAGQLCMANKGKNTNGMQFFITDGAAPWLDGGYTIFGECSPEDVVHKIGATPVAGETPVNKPRISKVTIRRE